MKSILILLFLICLAKLAGAQNAQGFTFQSKSRVLVPATNHKVCTAMTTQQGTLLHP